MAELRLELLKEEAKRPSSAGDISPSSFFNTAIEIEDRM